MPLVCVSEVGLNYPSDMPEGVSSLLLNLEMSPEEGCYGGRCLTLHN